MTHFLARWEDPAWSPLILPSGKTHTPQLYFGDAQLLCYTMLYHVIPCYTRLYLKSMLYQSVLITSKYPFMPGHPGMRPRSRQDVVLQHVFEGVEEQQGAKDADRWVEPGQNRPGYQSVWGIWGGSSWTTWNMDTMGWNDAHGTHSHPKARQHHQHISAVCSVHLPHANTTSAKTMKILPRRTGMHGVNPGNGWPENT